MKRLITKKKNGERVKGFTLMELLVSIAIFAIISVLMSNIVLKIAAFSLDTERRTDLLAELDGIANNIKNDLRSSDSIGFCSLPDGSSAMFFQHPNDPFPANSSHVYILATEPATATKSAQLIWKNVSLVGTSCTYASANPVPLPLSSVETINISKVNISRSCDDKLCGPTAKNTILFLQLDSCDPVNPLVKKKIFDCSNNPYRYEVAISTRVVQ
jgi:prepilin-type N-terminal cleavage/methylation domain-containing protein